MAYAEQTTVPISKSKAEIETMLERAGADEFVTGWSRTQGSAVSFRVEGLPYQIRIPNPSQEDLEAFQEAHPRSRVDNWIERETRRRWRCLALLCKAKLEMIAIGMTTFDKEFMADLLLPDGRSMHQWMHDGQLKKILNRSMPLGLPRGD